MAKPQMKRGMWSVLISLIGAIAAHLFYFILNVSSAGSFPKPLSAKEEKELLQRMRQKQDMEARNRLIEHNLRLVAHIIKKYYSSGYDQEDLISIGTIGLIKAISSFDDSKGTRLATYAARCIENEIFMHFRCAKKSAQDVYMSDPIDTDKDGNALTLVDVIADEGDIVENLDIKLKTERLAEFLADSLTARERKIVELRYGLRGREPLTQREVSKLLNISRSYVSRIEKKALEKLKKRFEGGEAAQTGK